MALYNPPTFVTILFSQKFKPFFPDVIILYPLKALEDLAVFCCFQGGKKCNIGEK